MTSGPRIPRLPERGQSALADNPRAAALHVTSRGALTPEQCLRLAEEDGTFATERRQPWMRWAYVAVLLLTLLACTAKPWGFAS